MKRYLDIHSHSPTSDAETWTLLNMHKQFEKIATLEACSIGLHPLHLDAPHAMTMGDLHHYATQSNVLAIGECGLDTKSTVPMDIQTDIFRQQIALANALRKPLIIHCVRAFDQTIRLLKEARTPVIFHGFVKNPALAQTLVDHGFYLSFGAALTKGQKNAIDSLASVPANRFFLETDDSNESIRTVYTQAAQTRNMTEGALVTQLHENYNTVFNQ